MEIVDERQTQETKTTKKTTKKTNKQTNKDRKKEGGREDILKGSELNDFVVYLS